MENIKTNFIRSNYFDNIKGILIILVVLGHLLEKFLDLGFIKYFYVLIFAFHMPLFIFCSGYFATNINFKKIFRRLLIPYILFQVLYFFFNKYVLKDVGVVFTLIDPAWTLWYLLSSAFWGILVQFIKKVNIKIILIAFAIGLLVGFLTPINYYLSLSRTIVFFPFFLLGFYCKKNEISFDKFKKNKLLIVVLSFFSLIIVSGIYIYLKDINSMWLYSFLSYKVLNYNMFIRLGIYLMALILSAMVMIITPNSRLHKITDIGKNSMVIYLLHGFIIKYLEKIFNYDILSSNIKILSYLSITTIIIVLVLSSKYIAIPIQKILKR